MLKRNQILLLVTVLSLVLFSCTVPQQSTASVAQSVKEEIQAIRDELSIMRLELHELRSDVKRILVELEFFKAAQAKTKKKKEPDTRIYKIDIGTSPILGPKDAPVTIVEFADLQCHFCLREYPKLKEILETYPKEVRLVFKHFPLSFHKDAKSAHAAVELAHLYGGSAAFWKMHDMIMANPKNLKTSKLREYAESLKLNLGEFDEIMADKNLTVELLKADHLEARKCKVSATPTVLINGLKLTNRSIDGYKTRIDHILKAGKDPNKPPAKTDKKPS